MIYGLSADQQKIGMVKV